MPAKIILTVTKGELSGKSFVFDGKEVLLLGRKSDCSIIIPEGTVGRSHCLLDIAPPSVRVRDLGSLNKTTLNDMKIGQRGEGVSAEEAWNDRKHHGEEFAVMSGDRVGLGPDCEITIEIKTDKEEERRLMNRNCEVCGVSLPAGNGPDICESCQKDPLKVLGTSKNTKEARIVFLNRVF